MVSHPIRIKQRKKFVPIAARISPVAAVTSLVAAVFVTLATWLGFKSLSPAVSLALGSAAGGLLLVIINRQRRRASPPSLVLGPAGVVIEDSLERIIIPWEELEEVRYVAEEEERLEFRSRFGGESFILSVASFSPDQAAEIKRSLLPEAA